MKTNLAVRIILAMESGKERILVIAHHSAVSINRNTVIIIQKKIFLEP